MRLLLDENLSHKLVPRLSSRFPGTVHVEEVGLRGRPDDVIWEYAAETGLILVSKDDDFRQLSFLRGHPPKVVWLVVGNAGTAAIAELLIGSYGLIAAFVQRSDDAILTLGFGAQGEP